MRFSFYEMSYYIFIAIVSKNLKENICQVLLVDMLMAAHGRRVRGMKHLALRLAQELATDDECITLVESNDDTLTSDLQGAAAESASQYMVPCQYC